MRRKRTASWRTKLLALLLLFSIAPMIGLATWILGGMADRTRESTLEALSVLARAKAEALDQATSYRKGHVERIASMLGPYLFELGEAEGEAAAAERRRAKAQEAAAAEEEPALPRLEDAEARPRDQEPAPGADRGARRQPETARRRRSTPRVEEALASLRRTLALVLWDQEVFEELLVMDAEGRVVASTYGDHEDRSAADLDYFRGGRRSTFVQPVFRSPITEELTMIIAAPVRTQDLQHLGVLAARLNLRRFFRLVHDQAGLGQTGETVVARVIDGQVVFMAPTRHDARAALEQVIEIGGKRGRALQNATRGRSGSGPDVDYRGVETFAAWEPVPSLEWGLAVKVDRAEAMAQVAAVRERTALIGLAILALVVLVSMLVSRALVEPLRALKEATDRISRGDFGVKLEIRSNDEIGELGDSFERMVAAIKFFREHQQPAEEEGEVGADADVGPPRGG